MTTKRPNGSLRSSLGLFALATAAIGLASGCAASSAGASGGAGTSGQAGTTGVAGTTGSAGTTGVAGTTGSAGSGSDAGAGSGGSTGAGGSSMDGGVNQSGPCSLFADPDKPAAKLSQTGCFDAANPTKMASFVVPYEVNSPLWSDGADKSRGFVLPKNGKIHVKDCATPSAECPAGSPDTGKWVLPVGTVLIKNFGFDGKLIETRLLMHVDDATWNGYSYEWNEAQTEATVVPADDDPSLNNDRAQASFNTGKQTVTWHFPYRFDCTTCHTQEAGGSLGFETRQMNRTVAGATANQIDAWTTAGYFEGSGPPKPYQAALTLPVAGQLGAVDAKATKEDRARSYLHANCAYCHRPNDQKVAWIDFRYDTALKDIGVCGVAPMKSTVGVDGALLLKPGKPMESVIWLRMHSPKIDEKTRMPQLATYVVDDAGTQLVSDWITSVTSCPN